MRLAISNFTKLVVKWVAKIKKKSRQINVFTYRSTMIGRFFKIFAYKGEITL